MVKFPEAEKRLFRNKFVCRKCKSVIRVPMAKIIAGKVKCRKCNSKALRAKRKK